MRRTGSDFANHYYAGSFLQRNWAQKAVSFFLLGTAVPVPIFKLLMCTRYLYFNCMHMLNPTGKAGYFVENSVMCDSLFIC